MRAGEQRAETVQKHRPTGPVRTQQQCRGSGVALAPHTTATLETDQMCSSARTQWQSLVLAARDIVPRNCPLTGILARRDSF